ncbi:hypothetical protein BDK51DRAFT_45571 [Blyttiomyces helicus]|uniref:Uncharacterized protein n=1 Tax=Blyttiomyces helicus TaxID=388810 RepID=A0A4P9WI23_9FUNG|nr:hypothetical protein BDK51DRAFT_45571 [Blyttiomyces helicus]|eukprot:RKO91513.1 hypothetical protein BDK51DRAFT_45571 [Blyttiomyces helicus]
MPLPTKPALCKAYAQLAFSIFKVQNVSADGSHPSPPHRKAVKEKVLMFESQSGGRGQGVLHISWARDALDGGDNFHARDYSSENLGGVVLNGDMDRHSFEMRVADVDAGLDSVWGKTELAGVLLDVADDLLDAACRYARMVQKIGDENHISQSISAAQTSAAMLPKFRALVTIDMSRGYPWTTGGLRPRRRTRSSVQLLQLQNAWSIEVYGQKRHPAASRWSNGQANILAAVDNAWSASGLSAWAKLRPPGRLGSLASLARPGVHLRECVVPNAMDVLFL